MAPCDPIELIDSQTGEKVASAIVCTRGRGWRCERCSRSSTALCDYVLWPARGGKRATCSARLCDEHRLRLGEDRDYCADCALLAFARGELRRERTPEGDGGAG